MNVNILFEDEAVIVCLKPQGIVAQADSAGRESMVSIFEEHTNAVIYPLHRLDREVGGVMVFAKTKAAAAKLSLDIAEHRFTKEYIALVHGKPEKMEGEFCDLLFKDSKRNKSFVVNRERKGVKKAVLQYEIIKTTETEKGLISAVKVMLLTGRTHQIRVQFSSRKMSLVGDKKYGARDNFREIGLFSYKIAFNHPITNQFLEFKALPQNFIADYI